jgi:hypothetical protein
MVLLRFGGPVSPEVSGTARRDALSWLTVVRDEAVYASAN